MKNVVKIKSATVLNLDNTVHYIPKEIKIIVGVLCADILFIIY